MGRKYWLVLGFGFLKVKTMKTKYIFYHPDGIERQSYNFSSDLEKIGYTWDVSIRNGTSIDIISDPVEIERPKYGRILVIKIRANIVDDYHTIIKEFWVPIECVMLNKWVNWLNNAPNVFLN